MDKKKLEHKIYSKLRNDKARLWSFSECSSYRNCPHEYYLQRRLKLKGKKNIYTESGVLSHGLLEDFYDGLIDRSEMSKKFSDGMLEIFTNGYRFKTPTIESRYMQNMRLYFDAFQGDPNIKKCEEFVSMPLWIYDKNLIDNYFQGWADAILEKDGEISIGDFKSSTRYMGKNLIEKSKQLILYAISYEYLYKKKVKSVFFDFLKYCQVTYTTPKGKESTKIVERRELFTVQNIIKVEKAYVFVDLTDEIKKEVLDWFLDTIRNIEKDEIFEKGVGKGNGDNYCDTLCGFKDQCIHYIGWSKDVKEKY